jgi:hypothetical protein
MSGQRHRPGVEHAIEIGAQGHDHLDLALADKTQHGLGEGPPAQMRLSADAENKILVEADAGAMVKIE